MRGTAILDRFELMGRGFTRFIGSGWFLTIVLALFAGSSALIAMSMKMSHYDEWWHLDIIRAYATQWSPRLDNDEVVPGMGDVQFTGSFLFHYLSSFPYRVIEAVAGDGFLTRMLMRLGGVALVTGGLFIYRQALLLILPSKAIANTVVGAFAGLPLMSFVAATVNYDNLLFLLSSLVFYGAFKVIRTDGVSLVWWIWFSALGCFASLTKFSFVPVFAALFVYLAIRYGAAIIRVVRSRPVTPPLRQLVAPVALFVIGAFFVVTRYVANLIRFGHPDPSCEIVADEAYCAEYVVWARNQEFLATFEPLEGSFGHMLTVLVDGWFRGTTQTLSWVGVREPGFWYLDSYGSALTRPLLFITTVVVVAFAIVLGHAISERFRAPIMIALGIHAAALFYLNYTNLLKYGLLFAYNARYFFPFVPGLLFLAVAGVAIALLRTTRRPHLIAASLFMFALLLMTQGGGPLTYLFAATPEWIHEDSPVNFLVEWGMRLAHWLM